MFRHILFLLAIVFLSMSTNFAQSDALYHSEWPSLGQVKFKQKYDELLGLNVDYPIFSKSVKRLEGQEITLRGYIIPTDGYKNHKEFVFSAYPYSMCFFCGGAGPESVIEVEAKNPIQYSAEPIVIRGKLKLNEDDPNALIYKLTEVEVMD